MSKSRRSKARRRFTFLPARSPVRVSGSKARAFPTCADAVAVIWSCKSTSRFRRSCRKRRQICCVSSRCCAVKTWPPRIAAFSPASSPRSSRTSLVAWAAGADAAAHIIVGALDDVLAIEGDDGHHLARVRRLRAGESVTAGDGNGAWRLYVVTDVRDGHLQLESRGTIEREPQLQPPLTVAFALTKG